MYSKKVLEHFLHPQNVGTIEHADGFGKAGGGSRCPEDLAYVWIRVVNERIVEIRHKTLGCPVAISSSSVATAMVKGRTLTEALQITPREVIEALGGIPERKTDSIVVLDALRQAIADYRKRRK